MFEIIYPRKHTFSNKSPFCAKEVDPFHICFNANTGTNLTNGMHAWKYLKIWLPTHHMDPLIITMILTMLDKWREPHVRLPPFVSPNQIYAKISADQHLIGWDAFLKGFVATSMITQQEKYLESLGSDTLGTYLGKGLCRQLWTICESFWYHRNQFLHDTPDEGEKQLQETLQEAIKTEYT